MREGIQGATWAFTRLGRLAALRGLATESWAAKAEAAEEAAKYIEWATRLESFVVRQYGAKVNRVGWGSNVRPDQIGVIVNGRVDLAALERELARSRAVCCARLHRCVTQPRHPLSTAATALVHQCWLELACELTAVSSDGETARNVEPPASPTRVLRGPKRTEVDATFEPSYSLLEHDVPGFGETLAECVPYFWNLSVREAMAADLCSLSIIEYDGLPLEFYRDMAKQAWDESLHAVYFLSQAQELLPDLIANLKIDSPLRLQLEAVGKLPIPAERNLYAAIWSMDLVDRLVLMHHDTETPAIPKLRVQMRGPFCERYPGVAAALDVVRFDEISHSRIGTRWLRVLVPNRAERVRAIEGARMLRGFYLVAALAAGSQTSPHEIVDAIASTAPALP
jgi:hypothetical protein